MPVARARGVSPVLVGRREELAALSALRRPLRPQVVVVAGAAGMGKTRLVEEACDGWREAGARVHVERFGSTAGPPYLPLREFLPEPATRSAAGRAALFAGLATVIDERAGRGWLVLVVEDLHWSDAATRDALAWLVTRAAPGPGWTLVLTQRHDPAGVLAAFWDVVASAVAVRIELEPLGIDEVADLAAAVGGRRPDQAVAEALHRRSGGIPLLVEEILAAPDGVPDHLRAMFRSRAVAGGRLLVDVLAVVAVAEACDEMLVAEVLGLRPGQLADALDRAVRDELLEVGVRGYRFRHELLREAVYEDLRPGRRRELHAQVAAILASRGGDPAVLAEHWSASGRRLETVVAAYDAARDAELAHAPAAALSHLETILIAWPSVPDDVRAGLGPRDELLRRAASAAERSGAFDRAAELALARTREPGTPAELAERWERVGRFRWEGGDGHGSRAAYQEAVRVLPAHAAPNVRATVLSGLAWHLAAGFDHTHAREWAKRGLDAAREVTDAQVLWQVALAEGVAWLPGTRSSTALQEACRLATALGDSDRIAISRMWLNISHQRLGHDTAREPNLRTALAAASSGSLGSGLEGALRYLLAEYLLDTGRWDEASAELDVNLGRRGLVGIPALFTWGYRARLAAWRGEVEVVGTAMARTRELSALAPQQPLALAAALAAEGQRLAWEGRLAAADHVVREAVAAGGVTGYDAAEALAERCAVAADLAAVQRRRGRVAAADPELESQVEGLSGEPSARAQAFLATCRAELGRGRGERDPAPWRAAAEAWQGAADPFREAIAWRRLAGVLLADRSGRHEAAVLLARARDEAARLGARPLAAEVARLSARARLTPGAGDPAVAALTSRELDVLELVAAGRSNAEIAAILVVSPRTVGTHVSRILQKLGAAGRTEAADLARRAGLVDTP